MQFTMNSESEIYFIKSISSNDLSLSFGLDEETISNFDSFNIKIKDKSKPDNTITLNIVPSGNGLKLFTPHDDIGKDLACDSNKQFELYFRPYNKTLKDLNYKDVCQIKYFDDGKAEGEQKLASLVSILMKDGKADEVIKAASDKDYRDSLYKKYAIA